MGTFVSISGGGNANVHIYGNGSVAAGSGNDTIQIDGNGNITVGAGQDVLTLNGSGYILQNGHNGNDTINLGSGRDSITEAGTATVHGSFGSATIEGGKFQFLGSGTNSNPYTELAVNGKATLVGGSQSTQFIGGSGSVVMQGGTGNDTFMGGSGQIYLESHSYDWLTSHGDITVSHGNAYIALDGGQTTVELKGFTGLTSSDVTTTHK